MRSIVYAAAIGTMVLSSLNAAWGDTVRTHDGRTFEGRVVSEPNAAIVEVDTALGRVALPVREVARIDYGPVKPADPPAVPSTVSPAPIPIEPGSAAPGVDARQLLAGPLAESERALTAAEGVAIWRQFLAEHPSGPLGEQARQRLAVWQERLDRDMVRFGPTWLERAEADRRIARADELLTQAESAQDLVAASRLYDEAAAAHPYRSDIPFAKARRLIRAKRYSEAGQALEQVRSLQPDHVAALNNLGAMAAGQKNWTPAFQHLCRAAASDNEVVFDNLAEALFLAWEAGVAPQTLAIVERRLAQIVEELQKSGKRVGQVRWGGAWVSEQRHAQIVKNNAALDAQLADRQARLAQAEKRQADAEAAMDSLPRTILFGRFPGFGRRGGGGPVREGLVREYQAAEEQARQARQEADRLRREINDLRRRRNSAPRPGRLVLIDSDGRGVLESVSTARAAENGD